MKKAISIIIILALCAGLTLPAAADGKGPDGEVLVPIGEPQKLTIDLSLDITKNAYWQNTDGTAASDGDTVVNPMHVTIDKVYNSFKRGYLMVTVDASLVFSRDVTLIDWDDNEKTLLHKAGEAYHPPERHTIEAAFDVVLKSDDKEYSVLVQWYFQTNNDGTIPLDEYDPLRPIASIAKSETQTEAPSSWAEEQVNAAIDANLVPQALQSKYKQATTRAEFAALAVTLYENLKGVISEGTYSGFSFSDTNDINVRKAAAIGVVNGVADNIFAPNSPLTREQAATMLSRLANAIGKPLAKQAAAFSDSAQVSSWALEAVGQMQATGIMGGVGDNTFAPKSDYTREQSIMTIYRLYNAVKP